jgi:hypothetical protein
MRPQFSEQEAELINTIYNNEQAFADSPDTGIMLSLFALCVDYRAIAGSLFIRNPGNRGRSANRE